ncbi:MAG: VOC family protein [Actinomycetota bacterium]
MSETTGGRTGPILDHLALASRRAWDNLIRYGDQFGGRWLAGPTDPAEDPFYFCHLEFAGGTKLELLEPYPGPGSDFLTRFLHRNGPGPHHLTFKVQDIEAAMATAGDLGYQIVNTQLESEDWKEAFLHPKQSHGIVIQLAQQGPDAGWDEPSPLPPTAQPQATIVGLTHLVTDLDAATTLFTDGLGMTVSREDDGPMGRSTILTSGPWRLRLVTPSAPGPVQWLGDRPGRLLQIEMEVDHPELVADLRPIEGGFELPPDKNQGTRVLLRTRTG